MLSESNAEILRAFFGEARRLARLAEARAMAVLPVFTGIGTSELRVCAPSDANQ